MRPTTRPVKSNPRTVQVPGTVGAQPMPLAERGFCFEGSLMPKVRHVRQFAKVHRVVAAAGHSVPVAGGVHAESLPGCSGGAPCTTVSACPRVGMSGSGVNRVMRWGFQELTIREPLAQSTPSQLPSPGAVDQRGDAPVATSTCKDVGVSPVHDGRDAVFDGDAIGGGAGVPTRVLPPCWWGRRRLPPEQSALKQSR